MKEKKYLTFEADCLKHDLPLPVREVRFHLTRRWLFDFAWWEQLVALEIEGGAFCGKGHRSVGKFLRDMEKYNEAALIGWKVLRCTTKDVKDGSVFKLLKRAFEV